jgi:hypothetical protein
MSIIRRISPLPPISPHWIRIELKIEAKTVEILHQKWRYYVHYRFDISTKKDSKFTLKLLRVEIVEMSEVFSSVSWRMHLTLRAIAAM